MNKDLQKSRDRVFAFMESVEEDRRIHEDDMKFMNSPEMKMRRLNDEKEKGRKYCIHKILSAMYKNALPLSNDYKVAYGTDLDDEIHNFMSDNPMERDYYVTDTYSNSPVMQKINRNVERLIDEKFEEVENNLEDTKAEDIKFTPDDELNENLQKITDDMGVEDVTNAIASNVQTVAKNEIERAKQEKETRANIEKQLANDLSITTKEAVDEYLELHDLVEKKDFKPRLFQGIMIGKTREMMEKFETGMYVGKFLFNALEGYHSEDNTEIKTSTPMEEAFLESVKEFTKLSLVKALRLEKFLYRDADSLALHYSQQ